MYEKDYDSQITPIPDSKIFQVEILHNYIIIIRRSHTSPIWKILGINFTGIFVLEQVLINYGDFFQIGEVYVNAPTGANIAC